MRRDGPHWSVSGVLVRSCLATMGSVHLLTPQLLSYVRAFGQQSHPISLISFCCFNSFEGKESKQNLGPQNLRDCRSWHLMAALPLVVASSYF